MLDKHHRAAAAWLGEYILRPCVSGDIDTSSLPFRLSKACHPAEARNGRYCSSTQSAFTSQNPGQMFAFVTNVLCTDASLDSLCAFSTPASCLVTASGNGRVLASRSCRPLAVSRDAQVPKTYSRTGSSRADSAHDCLEGGSVGVRMLPGTRMHIPGD